MTLQLDTPKSTLYTIYREHSHSLNVSTSYNEHCVFTFPFANPFCCLFCNVFILHNISKHYSVWLMTPIVCNISPISQKGGVAVLCPVAVLGTFPYSYIRTTHLAFQPLTATSIKAGEREKRGASMALEVQSWWEGETRYVYGLRGTKLVRGRNEVRLWP